MKSKIASITLLSCAIAVSGSLHAASVSSDWNNFASGTFSWETASNWDSYTWVSSAWSPTASTVPNNGADTFSARIMNGSPNSLTVQTGGNVSLGRFWLERSGAGSTTLRLGGNMTVTGALTGPPATGTNSRPTGFNNTVADTPSGLVLDLNGHTFDASASAAAALQSARNFTIRDGSASGNGSFVLQSITRNSSFISGAVQVEDNVTVKLTSYTSFDLRNSIGSTIDAGWTFAPNATLWLSANGSGASVNFNNSNGNQYGNVIVGSAGNSTASVYVLTSHATIQGDLTYLGGSLLSMSAGPRKIFLQGNLTDTATTGADYSGRGDQGGFVFNGGLDREQKVLVARSGLPSVFQIGESADIHGNVTLLHDLTTTQGGTLPGNQLTGRVVVWENSRLNVDTFTLQATTVDIHSDAELAFSFGQGIDNALIQATGTLSLGSFNLDLNYNGLGWNNGDDLLLFEYGVLNGAPSLTGISLDGFTYDQLFVDGAGGIWLTNVAAIPEPGTVFSFVGGMATLLVACRRKGCGGELRS